MNNSAWNERKTERVIVYIDGFNLYYGLRDKGWKRYYWLDLKKLANSLLKPGQQLVATKYFTARISTTNKNKKMRQNTFLEALGTLNDFHIYYGRYLEKPAKCFRCGATWKIPEEKMTDVSIGTEILLDAFNDKFDTALLVSADSDLVPPIDAVKQKFPHKKMVVAFPPARGSKNLRKSAHAYFTISRARFRDSVFPDEVKKPDGYVLKRPAEWQSNIKPE